MRYGRVPKRSRERSSAERERERVSTTDGELSAGSAGSETAVVVTVPAATGAEIKAGGGQPVYDIILAVSQAHHANCAYTEEGTRCLARKPLVYPPPVSPLSSPCPSPSPVSTTGQHTTITDDHEVCTRNQLSIRQ